MQSVYLQGIMKNNADMGYEKTNPKQTQFARRVKLMQSVYLQRIMKIKPSSGPKKTNPIQSQSKPILKRINVNFCAAGYYESKQKALKKPPLLKVNSEPLRKDW